MEPTELLALAAILVPEGAIGEVDQVESEMTCLPYVVHYSWPGPIGNRVTFQSQDQVQ